jgi:hypothetical protein
MPRLKNPLLLPKTNTLHKQKIINKYIETKKKEFEKKCEVSFN